MTLSPPTRTTLDAPAQIYDSLVSVLIRAGFQHRIGDDGALDMSDIQIMRGSPTGIAIAQSIGVAIVQNLRGRHDIFDLFGGQMVAPERTRYLRREG